MSDKELADFAVQLQQDLLSEASVAGEERMIRDVFVERTVADLCEERMIRDVFVERTVADLCEVGELEDGAACFHQTRGVEVSGYNLSEDNHLLDLYGVVLTQTAPPPTVPKSDVDTCIRRLRGFLDRARTGGYADREEALPVFDMFLRISQAWPEISRIRLFVFTDGVTTIDRVAEISVDEIGRASR